ncbi:MAG: DNA polymerase III subunit delta' C-terminal domain-containing protein [Pseudomonadota bacterium]
MSALSDADRALPSWLHSPWQQIQDNAARGRLGHALMLTGPEGVGKHLLAQAIRELALCGEHAVPACGICRSCVVARAGNHADDHEVLRPADKKTISVEQIRELIGKLDLSPSYGNRKIGLIAPAETMTTAAANALLKTLEEPPGDALLILVSHSTRALPATVLSRCQRIECAAPSYPEGRAWLTDALGSAEGDVCLSLAGGAPFQAEKYYNQGVESIYSSVIEDVSRLRLGRADVISVASGWTDEHLDVRLRTLYSMIRQLALEALDLEGELAHKTDLQSLRQGRGEIKLSALLGYQDAVLRARARLDSPLNQQLMIEALLAPWAEGLNSQGLEYQHQ